MRCWALTLLDRIGRPSFTFTVTNRPRVVAPVAERADSVSTGERRRARVVIVSARIVRMSVGDGSAAVAQLRAGVDALLGAPVDGLAATELTSVLEAVEVQRRRLEAVDQRLLAAASTVGVAAAFGQAGVADVLTYLLRIDPREARARVGWAGD